MMSVDQVPSSYIGKYYVMDPASEDVLESGHELASGMVVLLEGNGERARLPEDISTITEEQKYDVDMYNRWCYVYNPRLVGNDIVFIGIYSDGTKRQRRHLADRAWIVKNASKPYRPPYWCRTDV